MFATVESPVFILYGIATFLIVAPLCILTAGVYGWLLRRLEIDRQENLAGRGASHEPSATATHGDPRPPVGRRTHE